MSFNIRGSCHPEDGVNIWESRAPLNVRTIRRCAPNVIGFQEFQTGNLATYNEQLPDYSHILGFPTDNDEPSYNAIFWNTARFRLIDSDSFWLSQTPEHYSPGWDAKV